MTALRKVLFIATTCLLLAGCEQKMARQPRCDAYHPSPLFPDGKAARSLPAGTIARGLLRDDPVLYEGRPSATADFSDAFPFAVSREVLDRGRQRYGIYCVPCHGSTGQGDGRIVQRGYVRPPSYHIDRLRSAPAGYLFDVITRGSGAMPDYAAEVAVRDRWAIVGHIRVLQVSQNVPVAELSPLEREALSRQRRKGQNE